MNNSGIIYFIFDYWRCLMGKMVRDTPLRSAHTPYYCLTIS
ncbi:hypothetical protein [Okeania sp. KiyG1]|nr:hypothetical protein [Okeania sp. KiyG1]